MEHIVEQDFLTPASLRDMKLGAAFVTGGILPGISTVGTEWKLVELTHAKDKFLFELRYYHVRVGDVEVRVKGDVVTVEEK